MAADRRFPPINVLIGRVDLDGHAIERRENWEKIFASKKAYGCGKRGQDVVDGLDLFVRRGNYTDLTSSLSIGITDKSLRFIHKELGDDKKRLHGISPRLDMHVQGEIEIADERLTVLTLLFRLRNCKVLVYYIVYDPKASSLSMIPCLPDPYEATYTLTPVIESSGCAGDYVLVLLARDQCDDQDVLCVCNPDTRANSASTQNGISPWEIIRRSFTAKVQEPFYADTMFSFKGQAVWANLLQGLLYCNVHTSCPDGVDLMFMGLPHAYRVDFVDEEMNTEERLTEPTKMSRTIGCVRGSIYFIYIDRPGACGDEVVTMLTKDGLDDGPWRKKLQLTAKQLWELDGFEEAGLPKVAPEYPILMPDGVLCLHLHGEHARYICCVDVSSTSLLWHGCVGDYHTTEPLIVPPYFIGTKHARHYRKLAEHPASRRHEVSN